MLGSFNCFVLFLCWCIVTLVIAQQPTTTTTSTTTWRPHRHQQRNYHLRRHKAMHLANSNRTAAATAILDSSAVTQPSLVSGSRSQKLYLVSSSHQQPAFQPNVSHWSTGVVATSSRNGVHSHHSHSYHHYHHKHHNPHQRNTDFGFDWRNKASPRTMFADSPSYTTPAAPITSSATVIVQWPPQPSRPEHRFGKPHVW